MYIRKIFLLQYYFVLAYALYHCLDDQIYRNYHKVKSCYRSNGTILARSNFDTVQKCMKYAREKKGLAFNYSPEDAIVTEVAKPAPGDDGKVDEGDDYEEEDGVEPDDDEGDVEETDIEGEVGDDEKEDGDDDENDIEGKIEEGKIGSEKQKSNRKPGVEYNCQVLGCPEFADKKSLMNDTAYDYYSSYGNLTVLENATCIRSVGIFRLYDLHLNYTEAIERCQSIGADLATVHTDQRTAQLSAMVQNGIKDWYRVAYVGLDDRTAEGTFVTPLGDPMSCFKYRAWSPGHPRSKYKNEDCAVIDTERSWKVVNCKEKLPFICEYFNTAPMFIKNTTFVDVDCDDFDEEADIDNCETFQKNKEEYDSGYGNRCTAHLYS